MAKKTDGERLEELRKKEEQAKAKRVQLEQRLKEKERKERTRRLIQVGAIFEKYFDIEGGEEEAEQIAWALKDYVQKNKDKLKKIDLEKSKEQNAIVYREKEETVLIPDDNKNNLYK